MSSGTESLETAPDVLVSPNPNSGIFSLEISTGDAQVPVGLIEIFNVLGQKVYTENIRQTISSIDISGQPNGVYFVRITFNTRKRTVKMVKS